MKVFAAVAVVVLGGAAVGATAQGPRPSHDARLQLRAYYTGTHRVGVAASMAELTLRAAADTPVRQVAQWVEQAAFKANAVPHVLLQQVRRVRNHGLFLVELGQPVRQDILQALMAQLGAQPGVDAVYPVLNRADGRAFADDHLVVTAQPGQLDRVLASVLDKTGGQLLRTTRIPDTALVAVGARMGRDAVDASARLQGLAGLVSAEPELYREYALTATVDDPLHANQWHLYRSAPNVPVPGVAQIYVHHAWDHTKGDPAVVVAIFDSGMDVDHEDLAPNIVSMFDPSAGDEDARAECSASFDGAGEAAGCPADRPYFESHGTAVAGVVAARGDNGLGLSGVCPNCSLMAVRLLGDQVGSGLSTAEAFERAVDEGAAVINNSWGPARSRYFPLSQAERDAFDHARTAGRGGLGTVIVFAAGNSTANVSSDPYASHPFVIAVAASSNLDDWASYSNYGREIDVAAPSLGGTVQQDNYGIWTADVTGANGYTADAYTSDFSGTSAASPVVAGLAGLLLSAYPQLTAEQVRLVLTSSADKIRADKVDWVALSGQDINAIFAYDETGHSIGFGYGRINAKRAMEVAMNLTPEGGACDTMLCASCTADNRCLMACTTQANCEDGAICEGNVCQLPTVVAGAIGSGCTAECEHCTAALDTEGEVATICTAACNMDDDCPVGWDCRASDAAGNGLCAVGARTAGEREGAVNCRSDLVFSALVVGNTAGGAFCTDACFSDLPGSCPYGFHCGGARCVCESTSGNGFCRTYRCIEQSGSGTWLTPLCFPDDNFGATCASNAGCPPGEYCTAEGTCRANDLNGCDTMCSECNSAADCGDGMVCFTARFGGTGVCTRGCTTDETCPGDSVCRAIVRRNVTSFLCSSPGSTDPAAPCDTGYACEVACRADVPCADSTQVCQDGTCVAAPQPDAGMAPDAAASGSGSDASPPADDSPSCAGCSTGPAEGVFSLGLLAMALGRRRRAL